MRGSNRNKNFKDLDHPAKKLWKITDAQVS
jgi:hypothetical protein